MFKNSFLGSRSIDHELLDVLAGFRKGRGTRDQIAKIHWIIEKAREFQKNTYFCFIDYVKACDCVDHHKLWKILKEMGLPDHLTIVGCTGLAALRHVGIFPEQGSNLVSCTGRWIPYH